LQVKPPSSPEGRFTQVLSVGIGGSALGPQFVAEALAPDNPPLQVYDVLYLVGSLLMMILLFL
jgi:glucose-6-phosphate isomerase